MHPDNNFVIDNFCIEAISPISNSSEVSTSITISSRKPYGLIDSIFGQYMKMPEIKDVIFHDPATIVLWDDGTKTVVKCQKGTGDVYSKETGLAMAIVKKVYGNKGNYNDIFARWVGKGK